MRKGTEAVEGEVEMDASGEGFVNMGTVKVNAGNHPLLHLSQSVNGISNFIRLACVKLS